jgi:FAD synthase
MKSNTGWKAYVISTCHIDFLLLVILIFFLFWFLREEKKFKSLDELVLQLNRDKEICKKLTRGFT